MKKYKVITLIQLRYPDWVLRGWVDLQDSLNSGWVIERTDSFSGGGGWNVVGGSIVYILSKSVN